ncbi:MAG: hypothetical protein K2H00_04825, partial [Muribaculum intestinale]|nr:hypothetical protein [Muribaculum intestinale]
VNPSSCTEILGLAEGGLKVSLFVVNNLDPENAELLNAKYFKTMHHEFSHILHQTKTYPKEFDLINAAHYEPNTWQDRLGGTTCSLGFSSPYASGQAREDFAETCANYIVRTPDEWELTMWLAERGWNEIDDPYITYRLQGLFSWPANYDAVMKKYGFCYYYYRNEEDKKADLKTYIGQFVEREEVYYLTDMQVTADKDNAATYTYTQDGTNYFSFYNMEGGTKIFKKVSEFEDWMKTNFTDKGIELIPVADNDGQDGVKNLEKKVSIVREWFASAWDINIDELRALVQERQSDIHIDTLLQAIEDIDNVEDAE